MHLGLRLAGPPAGYDFSESSQRANPRMSRWQDVGLGLAVNLQNGTLPLPPSTSKIPDEQTNDRLRSARTQPEQFTREIGGEPDHVCIGQGKQPVRR